MSQKYAKPNNCMQPTAPRATAYAARQASTHTPRSSSQPPVIAAPFESKFRAAQRSSPTAIAQSAVGLALFGPTTRSEQFGSSDTHKTLPSTCGAIRRSDWFDVVIAAASRTGNRFNSGQMLRTVSTCATSIRPKSGLPASDSSTGPTLGNPLLEPGNRS